MDLVQDDKIGSVIVPVRTLMDMQEHSISVNLSRKANAEARRKSVGEQPPCTVVLRMVPIPKNIQTLTKTVFFIRHGESKWNQAQSEHNLKNMNIYFS